MEKMVGFCSYIMDVKKMNLKITEKYPKSKLNHMLKIIKHYDNWMRSFL